jgi:four helix bundle protein
MKNFRTYQLALELNRKAGQVKLKSHYRDQFERAVLSVALNLAEGSAKESAKDRARFYQIAFGSLREVQAMIEILNITELNEISRQLGGSLFNLCRALRH